MSNNEFKLQVDKLEGPEDWAKWKWHMNMVFRAYNLESIVSGESKCPVLPATGETAEQKKELQKWLQNDAKAASIIATALNKTTAELVLTCIHSADIWDKLCARFERSSTQRLNMLIESFFQARRDDKEDITVHVAKLQKLFVDLNTELENHNENKLSERILNGRILSTLGREYNNFKDLWDTIPTDQQKLNLLIEKLCSIEARELLNKTEVNEVAFMAKDTKVKNKSGVKKNVNSEKLARAKQKFPCNKCGKIGHWAAECSSKNFKMSTNGNERPKTESKGKTTAFIAYSLKANCENSIAADYWCCDSGASKHISPNKHHFVSFTNFCAPEKICLGKKDAVMLAYGHGTINVEVYINNEWENARLEDVWYVPDASINLFSVKAAASKGFKIILDEETVEIVRKENQKLVATGYLSKELYVLNMHSVNLTSAAQVNLSKENDTLQLYHERLAHQNKRYVKQILRRMNIDIADEKEDLCDGCALGKMHRLPFKKRPCQSEDTAELIHADVNGPMKTTSLGGSRYYVCFKDDFSKYRRIFFLKKKNEVCKALEQFLNEAATNGHTVKKIRCDGGGEFINKEVVDLLSRRGIEHVISPPYTPQQNGTAERENRTTVEAARSMLSASKLPQYLWAEACNTAIYILNRTGKTKVENKFPHELWYKRKVENLNHLRVFGTGCYVHIPKQFRSKFDNKSVFGHMVGYVNDKDGYRVWIPSRGKIICSHDVLFKSEKTCSIQPNAKVVSYLDEKDDESVIENQFDTQDEDNNPLTESINEEIDINDNNEVDNFPEEAVNEKRRSTRERKQPDWMKSGDFVMLSKEDADDYPKSYNEAMKTRQREKWKKAMNDELESLQENETWDLVQRPANVNVIKNRWVFRVKPPINGESRYKARLVAKGYVQKYGIDYDETFSPVARYDSIRTLLAIAAIKGMKITQFDVKTAFLYGTLQEEVYLEQPEGFEDRTDRVCRLKKSLYGLKQAPRCWNKRFIQFMKETGFKTSTADPCVFYRINQGKTLYAAIYVDDGLLVGTDEQEIKSFFKLLETEFKITTGSLENFLGMQIQYDGDGSISINQEEYTNKILKRFGMHEANAVSTPIGKEEVKDSPDVKGKVPYREAVGSLMYLTAATRPDIAFSVNKAARAMENPTEKDWSNVKRIFKYLKGTSSYCISYRNDGKPLKIYSDADFGGDTASRRSTTGVVVVLAGGAISWTSQLQRTVSLSTTEAELIAASEGAKELIWMKRLLTELLGLNQLPTLYVDNASAIKLAKNPEYHKRSKHIDIRYFYVREKYLNGELKLEHIDGQKQLADLFTKSLDKTRFDYLRSNIGVLELSPKV